MKKTKQAKRMLAGLLALLLAVTGVPLSGMEVRAADEVLTDGNFYYMVNKDGKSVMITHYNSGETTETSVTIPSEIDGKSVTAIGNGTFYGCSGLTSLTIPNSVTYIGQEAFSGCSGLTSLTIPDSVTSINDSAFLGCSGLTSLTIPDSVTSIGQHAFSGCSGLTSLTIPDSITSINYSAFKGCSGLTSLTIPSSVTSIRDSAFSGCSGLTSLTIPSSVTSINYSAFLGCSGLTSLTIPDSVSSIDDDAFLGCTALESITVGEGNTKYNSKNSCNAIIEETYDGFSLILGCKNTIIPDSVSSIRSNAFKGCSGLTSLTIPSSVTSIGYDAFSGCSSLTSLTIPSSVTSIDDRVFLGCSSLENINIPKSVTSIGSYAFGYIPNPYDNTINDRIKGFTIYGTKNSEAETYATENGFTFIGTADLSDAAITLEGEDEDYVWDGTPITPAVTVTLNGKTLTQGTDYTVSYHNNTDIGKAEVTVTGMGDYLGSQTISFQIKDTGWDGDFRYQVNGDGNSVTILKYDGADSKASIPETIAGKTVTIIDKEAFSLSYYWGNSDSPTNLTIPASVTSIGSKAFYNWRNLKSITIPSTVTSIGEHAFGFYEYEMDPDDGGDIIDKKVADFSINGEPGSAAEAYAAKYGFPFNGQSASGNTDGTSQNGGSQADISKAAMTLEKDSYTYDGKAKTPAVTVTLNGKTLTLNTDYTVAYTNNINVGTAKATVTGKGNYKGSVTKTFTITKANNSAGNNGTSDGNGSAGTSNPKQPITCKKRAYTVAYGTKPFKLKVTSNGSLTYKSSNSKIAAVGKTNGKVTIKNTGITYITAKTKTDSVKITIKVRPAKPKVKSLSTGKNRKLTVKWAKDKRATGYQVQISTSKNFKKNVKKQNTAKTAYTFKKLKAGSKYYVRLRSFKKSGKTTLYSAWSSPKQSGKIKR